MVRLQRFELKIRLLGFQDTPDSAPMIPRPHEPKLGGSGPRAQIPPPKGWGGNDPHPPLSFTFPGGSGRRGVEGVPCKGSGGLNVMDGVGALSKKLENA